jgi:hypothetical protein
LVGFSSDADRFFFFWLATFLLYMVAIAMALMGTFLFPNHLVRGCLFL